MSSTRATHNLSSDRKHPGRLATAIGDDIDVFLRRRGNADHTGALPAHLVRRHELPASVEGGRAIRL